MANGEHQILSLVRGKRTTIYHTLSIGKSSIQPKRRFFTVQQSGVLSGVGPGFGSATPPDFETFQPVTGINWNTTTGDIVVVVGAHEKYDNKPAMNIVTPFDQTLILIWNPQTNQYEGNDPNWIIEANKAAAQDPEIEYRINEASDCVLSVGGKKHQSWNLNGAWLMNCKLFMDDPLTP